MPLPEDYVDGESFGASDVNAITTQVNTNSDDITTLQGQTHYDPGGTDVTLADGGTGASLSAPAGDRIVFYDQSASHMDWLTVGTGLSITGTTMTATGGGGGGGAVDSIVEGDNVTVDDTDPANPIVSVPRVAARIASTPSSATPAINVDPETGIDMFIITALAVNITSMTTSLTGTPTDGQPLVIRIKDNGTARTIAWGSKFEDGSVPLPTTTVANKTLLVGLMYDAADAKWACEAQGSRP
jgi:hypothetical protein